MSQGSLKQIFDFFFKKLLIRYRRENQSAQEYLEDLFDVDNRNISMWQARRQFKMPGLYYIAGNIKVQGIGYRQVEKETILWLREDNRNKNYLDIEFLGGVGKESHVFCITSSEWNKIKPSLQPIDMAS